MRDIRYADPQRRLDKAVEEERRRVFFKMDAVPIAGTTTLTTERRRQVDLILASLDLPGYKHDAKRRILLRVCQSLIQAHCQGVAVMFSRGKSKSSRIDRQAIDALVAAGYAREIRSKPGFSDHCSRLLPRAKLVGSTLVDPWTVEPNAIKQFVFLYRRRDGDRDREEISFDENHPTARTWQRKLELINRVNNQYTITHRPQRPGGDGFASTQLQLRPVHFASFLDDFDHCGRLYTGPYGHQGLSKNERSTICFDGEPSIELDYSGLHTRLLYHLEGIDCRGDPYRLWGEETTDPMRELAKVYVNALINADSPKSARDACNYRMCRRTKTGEWKTGKAYRTAVTLHGFSKQTGLRFGDLHPLVMKRHHRIAHRFGCDLGITLMRIDAEIALNVIHHFARKGIPCLGVHDSFIVPQRHQAELKEEMLKKYASRTGHMPEVRA